MATIERKVLKKDDVKCRHKGIQKNSKRMTRECYHKMLFDAKIYEKSGCDKNNVLSLNVYNDAREYRKVYSAYIKTLLNV